MAIMAKETTTVVEVSDEDYAIIKRSADAEGITPDEWASNAVRQYLQRFIHPCVNCGADSFKVGGEIKHLRSKAIACDLDDPSSLNASW
jgi:hypothetical protein